MNIGDWETARPGKIVYIPHGQAAWWCNVCQVMYVLPEGQRHVCDRAAFGVCVG